MEIQKLVVLENDRKKWIGLLDSADPSILEAIKKDLNAIIDFTYIIKPETGMLMVQAKTDGSKARFNLGEAIVSRCILETKEQYIGASWVMGLISSMQNLPPCLTVLCRFRNTIRN